MGLEAKPTFRVSESKQIFIFFVNDVHIMIIRLRLNYLVSHELILFFSLQENSLTSEG